MRRLPKLSAHDTVADPRITPLHALLVAAQAEGPTADAALEDLLTALCDPIRRSATHHARGLVDVHEVAADLTQETLIGLAKGIRGCRARTDAEVVAWARAATRNAYIDMFRSPASGLAARLLAVELVDEIGQTATLSGDPAPHPNSPAMASLLRVVMDAYGDAVESTGEMFWWRLIMSLEWSEIAVKLSTTTAGAKRRFQRAQETLRQAVVTRVGALPAPERAEVVALLARFGYAEALEADLSDDVACGTPPLEAARHEVGSASHGRLDSPTPVGLASLEAA